MSDQKLADLIADYEAKFVVAEAAAAALEQAADAEQEARYANEEAEKAVRDHVNLLLGAARLRGRESTDRRDD